MILADYQLALAAADIGIRAAGCNARLQTIDILGKIALNQSSQRTTGYRYISCDTSAFRSEEMHDQDHALIFVSFSIAWKLDRDWQDA